METSKSAVAAAATVVPFHCIICFDEFNLTDKPPVILPCGHTYLCEPCSKRIRTCMECRTPLFFTPPVQASKPLPLRQNLNPRAYGSRYSAPQVAPHSPVKAPEPIPLPVPKNVVLLAMMEAAERQAMMSGGSVLDVSVEDVDDDGFSGHDDDKDEELQRILSGMESIAGPCGTYAVREAEGLAVLPQDPRKRNQEQVREPTETREPFTIEKGQTVQVVDVKDGVVKLARGMGYVVASDTQLVKVGGPLDKSCQLEGTLRMTERRMKELQRLLKETEKLTECLKEEIEEVEGQQPTHPIVTLKPDPELLPSHKPPSCPGTPVTKAETPIPPSPTIVSSGDEVELTDHPHPTTPGRQSHYMPEMTSPFSIDNADLHGRYTRLAEGENAMSVYRNEDDAPGLVQFGCSSLLFGRGCDSDDEQGMGERLMGLSFDSDNSDSPTALRPPALMCTPSVGTTHSISSAPSRSISSPHRTPSFDTIDFRTGLSGHRGLSTRTAVPRAVPSREIRMMGEHTGLGKMRGSRKTAHKGLYSR